MCVLTDVNGATAEDWSRFIADQEAACVSLRVALCDRETPADEAIGFVAGGGLRRRPRAGVIARREYSRFLKRWSAGLCGADAVDGLVWYYGQLWRSLKAAGEAS